MLTPNDLQHFMDERGIEGEIIFLQDETPTVEAAAQALGTQPGAIGKSVLFTIKNGAPILAISRGTRLIEKRVIAQLLEVGRKRVRLAPPEVVLEHTGYPVGTVPPFGHPSPLRTLLDPSVLELDQIYAGAGAHNAMLRLDPQDILKTCQAEIIDLHNITK
jgi:prolyl-tRNA editing enzyme YbaK/EbsC (Cys-tRNA(Pro) deacylase)